MAKKSWKIAAVALAVLVAGGSAYAVNVSASESISEAEAKQIALSEVPGADISHISKFAKDKDDGREEYDVEIIYGGYEYDFEISAKDGKVFDRSKEKADAIDIAKIEAQQNVKEEEKQVKEDAQKQEQSSGKSVVVEQERSSSGSNSSSGSSSSSSEKESGISLDKAKSIALSQVSGASSGNIVKAYKDYDDGRVEYDVEIKYNGYEYEFEIDGASGKILSKDIERIDDYDADDDRYDD